MRERKEHPQATFYTQRAKSSSGLCAEGMLQYGVQRFGEDTRCHGYHLAAGDTVST